MTQFYVVEIQQYANGEYGHIIHYVYDENPDAARNKGDSKYYEVMAVFRLMRLYCFLPRASRWCMDAIIIRQCQRLCQSLIL